ncbi:hypothetical protein ACC699_36130 [Rhizobium ruizarguesonis]
MSSMLSPTNSKKYLPSKPFRLMVAMMGADPSPHPRLIDRRLGGKNKGKSWDVERPILLKAHEVRGILDGRQTQLRRIVKRQPEDGREMKPRRNGAGNIVWMSWKGKAENADPVTGIYSAGWDLCKCPSGERGDRLWGREGFGLMSYDQGDESKIDIIYREDAWVLESDGKTRTDEPILNSDLDGGRWRPANHMCRHESRILLETISVRVERLLEISPEDCLAQGLSSHLREHDAVIDLFNQYGDLWQADHGYESWQSSPWVWVIEFKRVDAS